MLCARANWKMVYVDCSVTPRAMDCLGCQLTVNHLTRQLNMWVLVVMETKVAQSYRSNIIINTVVTVRKWIEIQNEMKFECERHGLSEKDGKKKKVKHVEVGNWNNEEETVIMESRVERKEWVRRKECARKEC